MWCKSKNRKQEPPAAVPVFVRIQHKQKFSVQRYKPTGTGGGSPRRGDGVAAGGGGSRPGAAAREGDIDVKSL